MTTGNNLALQEPNLPPTIRLYAQSLSPQECTSHRAWIGVRVEALLDGYWQNRPSDLVKAEILADWMDALQNFSPDEIRAGCRDYLSSQDCDRKPKPGDIRDMINRRRAAELAKWRASQPAAESVQPERTVSDEEMERRRKFGAEVAARFARTNTVGGAA